VNKNELRKHNILNNPNIIKTMIIMALPLFLSNLLKSFHDIVDSFYLARMDVSPETIASSLAAINIHWPIYNMFNAFGIGLSIAAVGIISQYVGAKQEKEAQIYSAKLITFAFSLGIIITALLFFSAPVISYLMGAKGQTSDFFITYLRYRSFEFPFYYVFAVYQSIRQARGDTMSPVILSASSILWNILFTWLLISVMKLGIHGAGISTLSAQLVIFPFVLVGLFKSKKHPNVDVKDLGYDKTILKEISRFALPSAISQLLSSLGFAVIQAMILSYGDVVSSGFSTGNRISGLLLNPAMAIGSVLAAFVGQNIGNNNPERALKSYKISRNMSFIFMVIGTAIALPLAPQLIVGIVGTKNPDINRVALEYSFWILTTQPLMALYTNYMSLYNGSGNNKFSLLISIIRLWGLRVPLVLFFMYGTSIGYQGIWYAMAISNVLILGLGHYLFRKVDFQKKVKTIDPKPTTATI